MKKQPNTQKDKHWHGRIYCNPDDPRVFIRRRPGLWAWTMNYANPRSWAFTAAAMLAVLALIFLFCFLSTIF